MTIVNMVGGGGGEIKKYPHLYHYLGNGNSSTGEQRYLVYYSASDVSGNGKYLINDSELVYSKAAAPSNVYTSETRLLYKIKDYFSKSGNFAFNYSLSNLPRFLCTTCPSGKTFTGKISGQMVSGGSSTFDDNYSLILGPSISCSVNGNSNSITLNFDPNGTSTGNLYYYNVYVPSTVTFHQFMLVNSIEITYS